MIRIYVFTCAVTGRRYVGQTTQEVKKRVREHHWRVPYTPMIFEVLATTTDQAEANLLEKHWIEKLGTMRPKGLNVHSGGGIVRRSFIVREAEMARLRALGVPDSVIGRKFDISKQRVGQILGPRNERS